MPKEEKETIAMIQKIILPSSEDTKTDQELIDNFLSHSDEEYREMGEEIKIVELKKELESGKITKKLEKPEAMLLIENGYYDALYDNIEHFKGIDKEVVMKFIQKVECEDIEDNEYRELEAFKGMLDKEIAMFMIENGYLVTLYENIEYFEGIDKEVMMKFIQELELKDIEDGHCRDFEGLKGMLDKEIAMFMIENGYLSTLYGNTEYFEGLDKEVVMKYIQKVECENIEDNDYRDLEKFEGLLDKEIAMFMIENGYLVTLYNNIEHFKGIDREVVMKFIDKIVENADEDLDDDYRKLEKFEGMLDKEIAMFMIENGYLGILYENIKHFEGIDREVVMEFIDKLVKDVDNYENQNLDDDYRDLKKFKKLFDREIAMFMTESGYHSILIKNLQYFGDDLDNKIASELIDKGYKLQVKKYKEKFKDLSFFTKMRLWGKTK